MKVAEQTKEDILVQNLTAEIVEFLGFKPSPKERKFIAVQLRRAYTTGMTNLARNYLTIKD